MQGQHIRLTKKYANYLDWTLEDTPRVFYVGKGVESRVNGSHKRMRNGLHAHLSHTLGIRREVVFETDDESEAYTHERELIAEHKTYAGGGDGWWGANLDLGGEGGRNTPKTPEHRAKIGNAHRGVPKSPEHCQAMSASAKVKEFTLAHRANIGAGSARCAATPEGRAARSQGAVAANAKRWSKPRTPEEYERFRAGLRLRSERAVVKKFHRLAHTWFTRLRKPSPVPGERSPT